MVSSSRTERLRRLAAVGQLTRSFAHEFNNVLGGILGAAQLLALQHEDARMRERLGSIVQSVERGIALTTALSQLAHEDDQDVEQVVDVHQLLADLLRDGAIPRVGAVALTAKEARTRGDAATLAESLSVLAHTIAGSGVLNLATSNPAVAGVNAADHASGTTWLCIDLSASSPLREGVRELLEHPLSIQGAGGDILVAGAVAAIRLAHGRVQLLETTAGSRLQISLRTA